MVPNTVKKWCAWLVDNGYWDKLKVDGGAWAYVEIRALEDGQIGIPKPEELGN